MKYGNTSGLFEFRPFRGAGWGWPWGTYGKWSVSVYFHCKRGLYIRIGREMGFNKWHFNSIWNWKQLKADRLYNRERKHLYG